MPSLLAALLFFKTATPLLYSLSLKRYPFEVSPSIAGGSTGSFGLELVGNLVGSYKTWGV